MSEKKNVSYAVSSIVEELKKNPSARFSKSDFQILVYGILSDKDFKAKKYLLRNDALVEDEVDIGAGMTKFLDKLLKHAGVSESSERAKIIDGFEYGPRDIEWVTDAVDEAMYQYTECGSSLSRRWYAPASTTARLHTRRLWSTALWPSRRRPRKVDVV